MNKKEATLKYLTIITMITLSILMIFVIFPFQDQYKLSDESISDEMTSISENNYEKKYEMVSKKVIPYIVYGMVEINGKTYIGEVKEDKQNGKDYCIYYDEKDHWYSNYYVTILENEEINVDKLSDEEIELYVNYNGFMSKSDYFIWVDIYRNETYILKKDNNYFKMYNRLLCSTGANITPTKRGLYEIESKDTHFYSRDNTYICYNYLQYSGSYLLHSFPYSLDKQVLDDRIKQRVSNGCVRYSFDDSKYLFDLIPISTSIWLN
ncbi:MAG: L,D-transpeptidase [Erysipelotrichaceae bacterium]|nr:L,D-transpeptidase [Erysipelotrichaceae bacterium]